MSGSFGNCWYLNQAIEYFSQLNCIIYAECTSCPDQADCFIEFVVFRAKNDGDTINSCFERVMNANSESSSDIRDLPIPVDGGKQTDTIDNQYIIGFEMGGYLAVTGYLFGTFPKNGLNVIFSDFVRNNDPFVIAGVMVDIFHQYVFIGRPRTSAHYGWLLPAERGYFDNFFC